MDKEEFYIGWQGDAPQGFSRTRSLFFVTCISLLIGFTVTYLFVEEGFVESYFDYGNLTEIEGRIIDYPVFGLKTKKDDKIVTVPLVGFGKFDALPVLEELKKRANGQNVVDLMVTLRGTVIYNKDKMWMELTEGLESIVTVKHNPSIEDQQHSVLGSMTVSGEIVDPKCFFGVMNPAYGKIHRSCAIRCISGGITPVLATKNETGFSDYYFVTDLEGEPLNKEILQYIGIPLKLKGQIEQVDDWKLIKIDLQDIASLSLQLDQYFTMCASQTSL